MTVLSRSNGHDHFSFTPKGYLRLSPPPTWVIYLAAAVCVRKAKIANKFCITPSQINLPAFTAWIGGIKLHMGGRGRPGMTFCDMRENGGWTNPRLRVQQAAGLRTKALKKGLEQRECPALPTPTRFQFCLCSYSIILVMVNTLSGGFLFLTI